MAVDIERNFDGRVSHLLWDILRLLSLGDEKARVSVPEISPSEERFAPVGLTSYQKPSQRNNKLPVNGFRTRIVISPT